MLKLRDPEKRRARRLENAEDALRDEVHYLDKWSFGDTPTRAKARKKRLYDLIIAVEALGGDALDVLAYGFAYLAKEAMPDVFERRHDWGDNRWYTYRKGADDGSY